MNLFIAHNSFIYVASVSVGMSLVLAYATDLCNQHFVLENIVTRPGCTVEPGHLGTNRICPVVQYMPTCAGGGGKGRPSSLGEKCPDCQSDLIFLHSLGPLLSV